MVDFLKTKSYNKKCYIRLQMIWLNVIENKKEKKMKRNLLFISRYPEIIDEFQGILEEKQIETEIAQNGTDAMELLKQKEYQILVTDLNLDGYNGDKILSYVNQKFPDTICMLYTNSISAVQLGFYLNKRDVFRVFLRPVNFRQEFMQALEEAYEFYDLKKRDRDSRQERLKQLEGNRKAIAEIEKIIENQNESWKDFEVFAERLLGFTMERYGRNLNTEQRRQYFCQRKKAVKGYV